jgi:hypothetical protein
MYLKFPISGMASDDNQNPWQVTTVTEFSFYCCPECDYKSKHVPTFMDHAVENHPKAREFCNITNDVKTEDVKCEIDMINDDIKFDIHQMSEDSGDDEDYVPKPRKLKQRKEKKEPVKVEFKEDELMSDNELPKIMSCSSCEDVFSKLIDLAEHCFMLHPNDAGKYECPACRYTCDGTQAKQRLTRHIRVQHETDKDRVDCPQCNRSIIQSNLSQHIQSMHTDNDDKKLKCSYDNCKYKSNDPIGISRHEQRVHNSRPSRFKCDKCSKGFEFASSLTQHVNKVHLKLKIYVCEKCGKGYNSRLFFLEHQAKPSCSFMTSTDVIFDCDKCEDKFNTVKGYIRHHESMHGDFPTNLNAGRVHLCDECPKIYLNKRTLEVHKKKIHYGTMKIYIPLKKKNKCSHCDKKFTNANNLEEHIKVKHEKHTPLNCDECTRSFGTQHALKTHKYNMHKRSRCEICGQSLCNTFWLKRHMSAAHGITPKGSYQCQYCPLFFNSKGAQDNHIEKQHSADSLKATANNATIS